MGFPLIWARRGPLRIVMLALLSKKPMSGIDIIREIERMSFGFWRPSPGTVYPLLRVLLEEGLIRRISEDGKKIYALTEKGRELAREYSIFLPARDINDVVACLESYASYLEEYVSEYGEISSEIREKIMSVIETLKKVCELR
ncbi:MAG: PadR family transcriptional regulator [Desulfurococcales archaeon ex4484_217_2]|nr:MAG: PadR family transcriptional regulator [Desulfurococcales archaeon ex4484_217_2]